MPSSTRIATQVPDGDPRFIYIGSGVSSGTLVGNVIGVPFPSEGTFETQRAVNAARNASNVVVGQMVGRSADKQNMTWSVLKRENWWRLNRWLESNGMFFYCKYFAHNTGRWMIRRFYCGDVSCDPYKIDADTGVPAFYRNCTLNVIDMGASYSYVVSEETI